MATAVLYLGEDVGARILRNGIGISQVGDAYALDVETWDLVPAGEMGDVSFRSIDVSAKITNGYRIGITPIIDGTALPEQVFSGAGTGNVASQAFVGQRGTRIAARVRSLELTGDLELLDISSMFVVLRKAP